MEDDTYRINKYMKSHCKFKVGILCIVIKHELHNKYTLSEISCFNILLKTN